MRVLIVDLVHGGNILGRRFLARGDEVTCVDVYGVASKDMKRQIAEEGIRVCSEVPAEKFDVTYMPTHCSRKFLGDADPGEIRSFSKGVEEFIDDDRFRIEVTGVKGKTSACYLLAQMLHDAGKKVLLHSSRGEGPWTDQGHRIDAKVSIAPPYIMTLPEGDYDVVICEVSLGGSGKADIACITNLVEDYGIAKKSLKASDAKKDIFCPNVNIVLSEEKDFWSQYCDRLTGYGGRVKVLSQPRLRQGLRVSVDYDGVSEITLDPGYISIQYIDAMDLALEVCHQMGIPKDSVLRSLESFKGVPGRGEILEEDGRTVIRERNPGISHLSIGRTLECLKRMDQLDGAMILLDPVSRKVCDKMDKDRIQEVVSSYGVPMVITKGDGNRPEIPSDVRLLIEFVKEAYQ